MFEGLDADMTERKSLIERPYSKDGVLVICQILYTLSDGMHVEICLWCCEEMTLWDVSIDKKEFDASGNTDFLKYLYDKGLPLEDVEMEGGSQWQYCGPVEDDAFYRIQYYETDD